MYRFAINRPIATLMLFLSFVVFGIVSLKNMSINTYPEVDIPLIRITTIANGDMGYIRNKITKKLEDEINSINGVKHIRSFSYDNLSVIMVEFHLDKDIEIALNDARDRIAKAKLGVQSVVEKMGSASETIFGLFVSAKDGNQTALMKVIDEKVKAFLQRFRGVGEVDDTGFLEPEIRISLDKNMIDKYSLSSENIAAIIKTQNLKMPLGKIESDISKITLKSAFDAKNINEIKSIRIMDGIFLGDIAKVEFTGSDNLSFATMYEGGKFKHGVFLEVKKILGANTLDIIKNIKANLSNLQTFIGENYELNIVYDKSLLIQQYVNQSTFDMILGVILTAFIVYLFLRNISSTIIATITIPTSIIATFFMIYLLGNDLNRITFVALTIGIGIFVDDAIVVIENISKHIQQGEKDPLKASFYGIKEIAFSVLAISTVLLCVFIPIAFMNSVVGRYFNAFALSVAGGIVVSFFVCIMLTPSLSARFMSTKHSKFYEASEPFFVAVENLYEKILKFVLKFRLAFVIVVLLGFVLCMLLAKSLGSGFKPNEDNSEFNIMIKADPSISAVAMREKSLEILNKINQNENVLYSYLLIAYNDAKEAYKAKIYTRLKELNQRNMRQPKIMEQLRKELKFDGFSIAIAELAMVDTGGSNEEVQLIVTGDDEKALDKIVPDIRKIFEESGKFVDISSINEDKKDQIEISINRQKAKVLGISEFEIARVINASFDSNLIGVFDDGINEYDIKMRFDDSFRSDEQALRNLRLKTHSGAYILLSDVATFTNTKVLPSLPRYDKQDQIEFLANTKGIVLSDAKAMLDEKVGALLPFGAQIKYSGFIDYMGDTNKAFVFTIMMSAVLVYMVLAALYESFVLPFIIMLSMPLAFAGAAFGLYISGNSFSLFVMVGAILLFGMVGKNAILLVDFANKYAKSGMEINQAIIKAGKTRFRAIVMTTLAMISAMLPLALSHGVGYEGNSPMAISIISGLISSTMLSLLVVPALFAWAFKLDTYLRKIYERKELDI
ncbi:MAG: efflux RND transporter permease subunit [Campylobacter sp.]|nr:efflux RND transporter permease subunit [Campylobacter sp.]